MEIPPVIDDLSLDCARHELKSLVPRSVSFRTNYLEWRATHRGGRNLEIREIEAVKKSFSQFQGGDARTKMSLSLHSVSRVLRLDFCLFGASGPRRRKEFPAAKPDLGRDLARASAN